MSLQAVDAAVFDAPWLPTAPTASDAGDADEGFSAATLPPAVALARQRSIERRRKEKGDTTTTAAGAAVSRAAGEASDETLVALALPLQPPRMTREVSVRTHKLSRVGLGQYRDKLVQRGLNTLEDLRRIDKATLRDVGMSPTEQHIFDIMVKADTAEKLMLSSLSSRAPDSKSSGGDGAEEEHEQEQEEGASCAICEEDDAPLRTLPCCRAKRFCDDCLAKALASNRRGYRTCPDSDCSGEAVPMELLVDLFRERCCKCCESFQPSAPSPLRRRGRNSSSKINNNNNNMSEDDNVVVAVECGFAHRAHQRCLRAHVVDAIKLHNYPIRCPAADLCKCTVTERGVRDLLLGGGGGGAAPKAAAEGGGDGADAHADNDAAADADADAESNLARFYELAYEHARRINGLQQPCPDPSCGAMVQIRAALRTAPRTFDVQCGACRRQWCPVRMLFTQDDDHSVIKWRRVLV